MSQVRMAPLSCLLSAHDWGVAMEPPDYRVALFCCRRCGRVEREAFFPEPLPSHAATMNGAGEGVTLQPEPDAQ